MCELELTLKYVTYYSDYSVQHLGTSSVTAEHLFIVEIEKPC